MQQESELKCTDGERLNKLKREQRYTWTEIAKDIGVTTSMIHMVRRGEKRLGREPSARLALIETTGQQALGNSGEQEGKTILTGSEAAGETKVYPVGGDDLLGHIVRLEDQLSYSRTKEDRLLKIIEALASKVQDHSYDASGPPAVAASGARYSTSENKTNKKGA